MDQSETRGEFAKTIGLRALASFLVLWTPFFAFIAYRDYPIPALSLLYFAVPCALLSLLLSLLCWRNGYLRQAIFFTCLLALFFDVQFEWFAKGLAYGACLGTLGLCWLLRQHLSTILIAIFTALLVSTAVIESLEPYSEFSRTAAKDANIGGEARSDLIVHLLLDEFTGIAGIPTEIPGGKELREELQAFFIANGFRLFGNAIGEYQQSRNSIAGTFNFTAGPEPNGLYEGTRPYVLSRNAYFEKLSADGYGINVYQSTYMDYCRGQPRLVKQCYTYRSDATNWLKEAELSDADKLNFVLGQYLRLSNIVEKPLKAYTKLERYAGREGIALPPLPEWSVNPAIFIAMAALDHLLEDIVSGSRGRAYFAHLLMPHGPFVVDAQCALRSDFDGWISNNPPYRKENSETERALRFPFYFEQIRCMQARLQVLFDRLRSAGLFDDATIIIHGDHGSRINRIPMRAKNRDQISKSDLLDGFSTLFAAKSPHLEPGYDDSLAPISRLLAKAIGQPELSTPAGSGVVIYLEGGDYDDPWTPLAWPIAE